MRKIKMYIAKVILFGGCVLFFSCSRLIQSNASIEKDEDIDGIVVLSVDSDK